MNLDELDQAKRGQQFDEAKTRQEPEKLLYDRIKIYQIYIKDK